MWWRPAALIAAVVAVLGVFAFRAAQVDYWIDEEAIGSFICFPLALTCGIVALVEPSHTNLLSFVSLLFMIEVINEPYAGSVTAAGLACECLAAALMSWSVGVTPRLSLPLAFAVWITTAKALERVLSIGCRTPAVVRGGDES